MARVKQCLGAATHCRRWAFEENKALAILPQIQTLLVDLVATPELQDLFFLLWKLGVLFNGTKHK